MKPVSDALREADPLREEPGVLEAEADRLRRAVLAGVPAMTTTARRRFRLSPAAVLVTAAMVAALGLIQFWSERTNLQAAVGFEVRLAEAQPRPGLRDARVADTERVVYLHSLSIATNGDIVKSAVVDGDRRGRFFVVVEFSPGAADRMQRATATHIGKPIAVLIDGEVVAAPIVTSPFRQSAVISGDYTRSEAERIAKGIRVP
jgi:preprotein translocase subunit SecD